MRGAALRVAFNAGTTAAERALAKALSLAVRQLRAIERRSAPAEAAAVHEAAERVIDEAYLSDKAGELLTLACRRTASGSEPWPLERPR